MEMTIVPKEAGVYNFMIIGINEFARNCRLLIGELKNIKGGKCIMFPHTKNPLNHSLLCTTNHNLHWTCYKYSLGTPPLIPWESYLLLYGEDSLPFPLKKKISAVSSYLAYSGCWIDPWDLEAPLLLTTKCFFVALSWNAQGFRKDLESFFEVLCPAYSLQVASFSNHNGILLSSNEKLYLNFPPIISHVNQHITFLLDRISAFIRFSCKKYLVQI